MFKSRLHIYINNSVAFVLFSILRTIFRRRKYDSKNILFINTGQIGDLIVSSVIFTNQEILTSGREVYLLTRDRYMELYKDYQGPIKIIPWNYQRYKYNPFYRITFIRKLRKMEFEYCVNLTAARGITNDEVSILSGAQKILCLNNNWKYLTKLFGKAMDAQYDDIFAFNTINEPERNVKILELITGKAMSPQTIVHIKQETVDNVLAGLKRNIDGVDSKKIIAIAPISDGAFRNWPLESYSDLVRHMLLNIDVNILLIGTKGQKEALDRIAAINPSRIWNLAGMYSVVESSVIVNYGDVFIGNDSGFTHIVKALGKKYIGIIGGGCYGIFFPYNVNRNEHLFFHKLDCFGCEWRCIYEEARCVQNVKSEDVFKKVIDFLK